MVSRRWLRSARMENHRAGPSCDRRRRHWPAADWSRSCAGTDLPVRSPRAAPGCAARPGRAAWPLLQIECRQSTISPCASRSASISIAIAAPNGACDISSCARPLHPHRPAAGRLGQQHGIERDVVGGVVAVAAGALHMLDGDVLERQFENQRQIGAQKIDALAVGPDVDAVAGPTARWRRTARSRRARYRGGYIAAGSCAPLRRAAAAVFVSMTVDSDGWAFRNEARSFSSGSGSPSDHVAPLRNALSAASAPCSVSLTTPAKLPSRTMATRPATARAPSSFNSTSLARDVLRSQHAAMQHSRAAPDRG